MNRYKQKTATVGIPAHFWSGQIFIRDDPGPLLIVFVNVLFGATEEMKEKQS